MIMVRGAAPGERVPLWEGSQEGSLSSPGPRENAAAAAQPIASQGGIAGGQFARWPDIG